MGEPLPPIHDAVRFWQKSEAATLSACVKFRRSPLPAWNLNWLRQAAPTIMTGGLSETALRHAVREKVFPEAQKSVLRALELFCRFVDKHKWKGKSISTQYYRLPSGAVTKVEPIGRYFSEHLRSEWIVALQPRQDDFPNPEQFSMWRTALYHIFCDDLDNVMIVDISKNPVNQKRELREITARKYPLIDQSELNARLEMVAACYLRAVELVPERPPRVTKDDSKDRGFDF